MTEIKLKIHKLSRRLPGQEKKKTHYFGGHPFSKTQEFWFELVKLTTQQGCITMGI